MVLAGVLDHPLAPTITVEEAFDRVGDDLVVLLLWLVCGLVATAGADADWLIQYDLDPLTPKSDRQLVRVGQTGCSG
jgi:hypothetical protein